MFVIDRVKIADAIAEAIGRDTYDCTRVWEAWRHGTMRECDFVQLYDSVDRVDEIVDAVVAAITPQPSETDEGWCDVKVAFAIDDEEVLWNTTWNAPQDIWPKGWKHAETISSGARCVAVFRVDHLPTADETRAVNARLETIKAK